jgi:type II secretory pathway pseudopilin PulG
VEVAIVLSVMALLTGVLAPASFDLMAQARDVRVRQDCEGIRHALIALLTDVGRTTLTTGGPNGFRVDLLVTTAPAPAAASPTEHAWTRDADGTGAVDWLDRHLLTNDPAGDAARSWPLPTHAGSSGWRGAYLHTPPGADPWGHRYAVNVQYLGTRSDVLILSAGPDGLLETPYHARNLAYGGDDVAVLVR